MVPEGRGLKGVKLVTAHKYLGLLEALDEF